MPIYEFECGECGRRFEELVRVGEVPPCPACGAAEPRRLLSPVFPAPRIGLRGEAARRSDATRSAREERRQEGFALDRERRRQEGADYKRRQPPG